MEHLEGNKLIFDFMGCAHSDNPDIDGWEMNALVYHTSWDWLMPVVEKIEKLPVSTWVKIYGDLKLSECEISNENCDHDENGLWKPIVVVQKITKIEAVWFAVIQFIQWYNSQNK